MFCVFITTNLCAQGVTKYGEITTTSTNFVDKNGKIGSLAMVDIYGKILCGNPLTINHTAGTGAPANLTINYGTVATNLSGASKCWITQDLGATTQAASATDASNAAAGWYWQFNRMQGYAVGSTPAWGSKNINETSDWLPANDPCTLELGTGWRIPTQTEWTIVSTGWITYTDAYVSVLKLHAAGYLTNTFGALTSSGTNGYYWSSAQDGKTDGWRLGFASGASTMGNSSKASGYSLRCLRD